MWKVPLSLKQTNALEGQQDRSNTCCVSANVTLQFTGPPPPFNEKNALFMLPLCYIYDMLSLSLRARKKRKFPPLGPVSKCLRYECLWKTIALSVVSPCRFSPVARAARAWPLACDWSRRMTTVRSLVCRSRWEDGMRALCSDWPITE